MKHMRKRRASRRRAAAVLMVAASFASVFAAAPSGNADSPRVIWDDGVGVTVPPPGTGVTASAMTATGEEDLTVLTGEDGTVRVIRDPEVSHSEQASQASGAVRGANPCPNCPKACRDGAYALLSYKVSSTFQWFYNRESSPSSVSADNAQSEIVQAFNNLANQKNNCSLSDQVSATHKFMGDTTATTNITPNFQCQQNDGQSTVAFDNLNGPAVTCAWYSTSSGRPVTNADVRIDEDMSWTIWPGLIICNRQWDVQGMVTHEAGHVFGLSHVSPSHGNLTMSTYGLPDCSKAYRTWGKGDVRGLRALY